MDEFEDDSNLNGGDSWHQKYTNWEQECIEQIETLPDNESQMESEKASLAHKLWVAFQTAACSVAQLYKDREQNVSLWMPFQNAAQSVTSLYKDSIESQKRLLEYGLQCGQQRRNKELLAWAKKRKRHIRREDLISFLSGRNSGAYVNLHHYQYSHHRNSWNSPKQRLSLNSMNDSGLSGSGGRTPPHHNHNHTLPLTRLTLTETLADANSSSNLNNSNDGEDGDLETFREALALSVGVRSSPQHGNSGNSRRNNPITRVANNSSSYAELNAFITEEFNRHVESRKRTASSNDVIMDSPTHKRSKLT